MKNNIKFYSNKSFYVKMLTITYLTILLFSLLYLFNNYKIVYGIIISSFIFSITFYFFSISLKEVYLKDNVIYIKKQIGRIELNLIDIVDISTIPPSFLNLSYGSKGFMGFNGSTMGNEYIYVNDLSKMIRITTKHKSYIISLKDRDSFINQIKKIK